MTEPAMPEEITVTIGIKRDQLVDDAKMCAVFLRFKAAGWTGGVIGMRMPSGAIESKLQLDKDGKQIIASIGDIIVCIDGAYNAMTVDEYAARYGAGEGAS